MADKTLKITFSGICSLLPAPSADEGDKAFVMMAANGATGSKASRQVNAWGATIPDHFPFVHVDRSLLVDPPEPSEIVAGNRSIYYFENARVVIEPSPRKFTGIHYIIDPQPLGERPGSNDVASSRDFRWLADIRDIVPQPPSLNPGADPSGPTIGAVVAAVVNLDGGTVEANFPGDTVNPKIFRDANGKVVLKRVMASEFIIEIPYPADLEKVTLSFNELRAGTPVTGPPKLVLKWPKGESTISVRVGNDPKEEVRLLDTPARFDPVRRTGPVLKPRDDDFDLHYNFLNVTPDQRLLPEVDIHQCHADGCLPARIG